MTIPHALTLGIIQGLTEFLPISSSGHLVFLPVLFGWEDQGLAFDAMLHVGTLVAVVFYFRKKLWEIFVGMKQIRGLYADDANHADMSIPDSSFRILTSRRLGWLLLLSTIPAVVVGFLLQKVVQIEIRSTAVIGFNFIFWGVILYIADRYNNNLHKNNLLVLNSAKPDSQSPSLQSIGWKQTLFIGCAQAVALIPGVSRSGITMTAGLFSKFDKKSAAEFSFLMSVPIIAMAGGLKVFQLFRYGLLDLQIHSLVIGFVASMVSGFFAIHWLMKIIQKYSFLPFVVYRIVVGLLILVFLA